MAEKNSIESVVKLNAFAVKIPANSAKMTVKTRAKTSFLRYPRQELSCEGEREQSCEGAVSVESAVGSEGGQNCKSDVICKGYSDRKSVV